MKSKILSLGTRKDATTWENGCKSIGFDVPLPIKKPKPSMDTLESFFKTSPEWMFFAGHFDSSTLSNEDGSVEIQFNDSSVEIAIDEETKTLNKNRNEFNLHKNCQVVLWGGCSVCSGKETIRTLRSVFGTQHLLLGFAGLTGWKMVDAMLGGGFLKKNNFFKLVTDSANLVNVRDAWMNAAKAGYGGGENESKFRAIDPNGQEWKLHNGEIIRGQSHS